jgi:sorbitol-specific phosphotransferase system component IIC
MIAALLPLIPLLSTIIPQIAEWIGGDDAEAAARQVAGAVTAIAGSTDPAAVAAVIADPLAAELARIAAERAKAAEDAQTARIVAALADTADARKHTLALAARGSRLAWMPAIITFALLGLLGGALFIVFTGSIPEANTRLADQLIGGLYTLVTTAVAYWVGTSRGAVEMRQGLEQAAHGQGGRS